MHTCRFRSAQLSLFCVLLLLTCLFAPQRVSAQPDDAEYRRRVLIERMKKEIDEAFSPVGTWTFTRLEVVTNAALAGGGADASYELKSTLVRGTFTVGDDGSIAGEGVAAYSINVDAGANAPLPIPIPIRGKVRGSGERSFTVTGQADLENKTISLDSCQPEEKPIKLNLIAPGAKTTVDWPPWPPMTNLVKIPSRVQGSSVVMSGSGTVGQFTVTFEAVKHVDLANLFEMLAQATIPGAKGARGEKGERGAAGPPGADGSPGEKGDAGEQGEKGESNENEDPGASGTGFNGRAGTAVVTAGEPVSVRFQKPLPDNRYAVSLTPASTPAAQGVLTYSKKTATGFTVLLRPGSPRQAGTTLQVDWVAIPYR